MTRWRIHEERARSSGVFRGYKVWPQKVSTSTGKRPDYLGVSRRNPKDRIVADAKYVRTLTPEHLDQVKGYKSHPFYARKAVIFVKKSTRVPSEVRNEARQAHIRIIRKVARKPNKSLWDRIFG